MINKNIIIIQRISKTFHNRCTPNRQFTILDCLTIRPLDT